MLTNRGWWFIIIASIMVGIGASFAGKVNPTTALLGITLLAWIAIEYVVFAVRYRTMRTKLEVTREFRIANRPVNTVWAGSPVKVSLHFSMPDSYKVPYVIVEDRVPANVTLESSAQACIELTDQPYTLDYNIKPKSMGVLHFEGVQIRVADLSGLFFRKYFIRQSIDVVVMPMITDRKGKPASPKRYNMLPPPGIHRHLRPGSGSELLELRDYRPGDPPKMIAWKASARRDRLITKEYESDVPVRAQVFLDVSQSTLRGEPGETICVQMATLAANIIQSAIRQQDMVGLTNFAEESQETIVPARTRPHQLRLLAVLAHVAARSPTIAVTSIAKLMQAAHTLADEVYPDLLARDINSTPWGLYWRPLLDSRWFWLVLALFLTPFTCLYTPILTTVISLANAVSPTGWGWLAFLIMVSLPTFVAWQIWLYRGLSGFFSQRKRDRRRRKELSALYACIDGADPMTLELYLNDDASFIQRSCEFLQEHHVRKNSRVNSTNDNNTKKWNQLAKSLSYSMSTAKDNELYIILVDINDRDESLLSALSAIRAARARHHQVICIIPRPAELSLADYRKENKSVKLANLLDYVLERRQRESDRASLNLLRESGATIVEMEIDKALDTVLSMFDRLRGTRVKR